LHIERLLCFVGNDHPRITVAPGDKLSVKLAILHGLKKLNGQSVPGLRIAGGVSCRFRAATQTANQEQNTDPQKPVARHRRYLGKNALKASQRQLARQPSG
jgi:hypothetical protein